MASSRAVLLALLFPGPCDPLCPDDFKAPAQRLLPGLGCLQRARHGDTDEDRRRGLLRFIGDFADWQLSSNARYLETARALARAAHPDEPPLVADPCGVDGSIPLEALRVVCDAFACDLNPVACLMLKVMLEDIPRHGPELADKPDPQQDPQPNSEPTPEPGPSRVRVSGSIPPAVWSRFGTTVLPQLEAGADLAIEVGLPADLTAGAAAGLQKDLTQILEDLDIDQRASLGSS